MICKDNIQDRNQSVYDYVKAYMLLNDISNKNEDEVIKDIFNKIKDKLESKYLKEGENSVDASNFSTLLASNYARLIPSFMFNVIIGNSQIENNINLNNLQELNKTFSDNKDGFDYVANRLLGVDSDKIESFAEGLRNIRNEYNNWVNKQKAIDKQNAKAIKQPLQDERIITVSEEHFFEPLVAQTTFIDNDFEYYYDESIKQFVLDPLRKPAYDAKRKILQHIFDNNIDTSKDGLTINGIEGIKLKAVKIGDIKNEALRTKVINQSNTKDNYPNGIENHLVLLLVDNKDNPVYLQGESFTLDSNNSEELFYFMKPYSIEEFDINKLSDIEKSRYRNSLAYMILKQGKYASAKQIGDNLELLYNEYAKVYNHILNDTENGYSFNISFGSFGNIKQYNNKFERINSLSQEEVSKLELTYNDKKQTITSPTIYNQAFPIKKIAISEDDALMEMIISIIADDIIYNGKPISNKQRSSLLENYIEQQRDFGLLVKSDGVMIESKLYQVGDNITIEELKNKLRDYFNSDSSVIKEYPLTQKAFDGIKDKSKYIATNKRDSEGNTIYRVKGKAIAQLKPIGKFKAYELNKKEDGTIELVDNRDNKKEQYTKYLATVVKSSLVIVDGSFVVSNPYFDIALDNESEELFNKGFETDTDVDDIDIEEITLDKLKALKSSNKAVNQAEIDAALEWYNNSPLKKFFPFEAAFNLINSNDPDSIATWSINGITLFNGSDYTELYHEAFHGFFQAFMTKAQKKSLFTELRKQSGSFTDYNGKNISFKKANDKQLEEYLAEDFREYMIKGEVKKPTPVKMNLFQKILRFLSYLFDGISIEDQIIEETVNKKLFDLYENLRVGNINELDFNEANITNSKMNSTVNKLQSNKDEEIQSIGYRDSITLSKSIDSLFIRALDYKNSYGDISDKELERKLNQAHSKQSINFPLTIDEEDLLKSNIKKTNSYTLDYLTDKDKLTWLYDYVKNVFIVQSNILSKKQESEKDVLKKNKIANNIKLLNWAVNNFGNLEDLYDNNEDTGGLIAYHLQKSDFLELEEKEKFFDGDLYEEDDTITEEQKELEEGREGSINREGNKTSVKDRANKEIVYIVKSSFKRDKKTGDIMYNDLGFPEPSAFDETWNALVLSLSNSLKVDEMFRRMDKLSKRYPQFKDIISMLGSLNSSDNFTQEIWTKFHRTFNNSHVPLIQLALNTITVDKNGNELENSDYEVKVGNVSTFFKKVGQQWESNFYNIIKETNGVLDTQKLLDNFDYNKYASQRKRDTKFKMLRDFLFDIGIELDNDSDLARELIDADIFHWIYDGIKSINKFGIEIKSLPELFKKYKTDDYTINPTTTHYNFLQQLEARYSSEYSNFQVTNAKGDIQFEHQLNNTITTITDTFNNVDDYNELMLYPYMQRYNIDKNPFMKSSKILNSLFELQLPKDHSDYGTRKKDKYGKPVQLVLRNLSGVQLQENGQISDTGEATASVDEYGKLLTDIHTFMMTGQVEAMRHADKRTSYSFGVSNVDNDSFDTAFDKQNLYFQVLDFFKSLKESNDSRYSYGEENAYNQVLGYLSSELDRIRKATEMFNDKSVTEYDFKYLERGMEFNYFDKVITNKTKKQLKKLSNDKTLLEHLKDNEELKDELFKEFKIYFSHQTKKNYDKFSESAFISNSLKSQVINHLRNWAYNNSEGNQAKEQYYNNKIQHYSSNDKIFNKILLHAFTLNAWVHNVESTFMIYGDLANYREQEFNKRNAGAGSTGIGYREDDAFKDYINSTNFRGYEKIMTDKYDLKVTENYNRSYDGTLNTAVMEDVVSQSVYYKEYLELAKEYVKNRKKGLSEKDINKEAETLVRKYKTVKDEADAQCYISFDSYRLLKIANGSWDFQKQEPLYRKIINGEKISIKDVDTFFPVIKNQYWGEVQTEEDYLPLIGMHKYSMLPLIPNMYKKGSNLDKLHLKMMRDGIDYVTFQSASKMGTIYNRDRGLDKFVKDSKTREFDNTPFVKNPIFVNFLKDQLEIAPKFKKEVVFSTQLRSLIEDGFMENNVPTDFFGTKEEWDSLSEKDKLNVSPYYGIVREYELLLNELTQRKQKSLLREANMELDEDGNIKGKMEDLLNFVKRQLQQQDISEHELETIGIIDGKLKNDLSLVLTSEKIEKMLNAIVTNRLVKQKITGEHLILAAGTGWENIDDITAEQKVFNNEKDELSDAIKKYGTNGLSFYHLDSNGEMLPMTVRISMQSKFKHLLRDDDVKKYAKENNIDRLDALNILIKDEAWLSKGNNKKMITMIGVRIPVQSVNSMESMQVYEFLPESTGNILIPPAELVTKAGSDYDVDKMTVYMPSISMVDNKPYYDKSVKNKLSKDELIKAKKEVIQKSKELQDKIKERYDSLKKQKVFKGLDISEQKELDDLIESFDNENNDIIAELEAYVNARESEFVLSYNEKQISRFNEIQSNMLTARNNLNRLLEERTEIISSFVKEKKNEKITNYWERQSKQLEPLQKEINDLQEQIIGDGETGVENDLIDTVRRMITHKINHFKLIRPNDTDMVKYLAEELESVVSDYDKYDRVHDKDIRELSPTSALEVLHNINVHVSNNIGMQVLGIGAVQNTANVKNNRANARLSANTLGIEHKDIDDFFNESNLNIDKVEKYFDIINIILKSNGERPLYASTYKKEKYYSNTMSSAKKAHQYVQSNYKKQTLLLNHNKMKDNAGNDIISLSNLFDAYGNNSISEVIGQLINGWVDVAKDAWIFYIQGNKELAPSLLFLIEAGVNVEEAVLFVSNPLIREYAKLQRKYSGVFAKAITGIGNRSFAQIEAKKEILGKYFSGSLFDDKGKLIKSKLNQFTEELTSKEKDNFNKQSLRSGVKKSLGDAITDLDRAALLHFLDIEEMESSLKQLKLKLNVDTKKSKTLFEAQDKKNLIKELEADKRFPNDILSNLKGEWSNGKLVNPTSSLSSFFIQDFQLEIYKELFPFKLNESINDYLSEYVNSKKGKGVIANSRFKKNKERYFNTWKSSLISYIFQNEILGIPVNEGGKVSLSKIYGYNIKTKSIDKALPIEVKGDSLYVDFGKIMSQYKKKEYTGIYGLNREAFKSIQEYIRFSLKLAIHREQSPSMSRRELVDKALDTSLNQWKLFNSDNSYAQQFEDIEAKYPELKQYYELFSNLIKNTSKDGTYHNLMKTKSKLDVDTVGIIHEEIMQLMKGEFKPEITLTKEQKQEVQDFFVRMPFVALLQSGQKTSGSFSLLQLVPTENVNKLIKIGVDKFLNDSKGVSNKLENFTSKFNAENSIGNKNIGRGYNYLADDNALMDFINSIKEEQGTTTSEIANGVEISSNSKGLAAALTNPTELAKSKGNITQSYPITFNGVMYNDVEQAFQKLKDKSEAKTKPTIKNSNNYKLMVGLIKAKLEQYPRLVTEINRQGGSEWILGSTHQPTKQNTVWETGGQNWFIKTLNEAYNKVNTKTSTTLSKEEINKLSSQLNMTEEEAISTYNSMSLEEQRVMKERIKSCM